MGVDNSYSNIHYTVPCYWTVRTRERVVVIKTRLRTAAKVYCGRALNERALETRPSTPQDLEQYEILEAEYDATAQELFGESKILQIGLLDLRSQPSIG